MATRQSKVFLLAVLFGIAGMAFIAVARICAPPSLAYYSQRVILLAHKYHALKSLPTDSLKMQKRLDLEALHKEFGVGAYKDERFYKEMLIALSSLLAFVFGCISLNLTITGWSEKYHWKYIFSIIPDYS